MIHQLEIIGIYEIKGHGQFIFAKIADNDSFELKEGSAINDIAILPYLTMPRMLDEHGKPRLDVFGFRPVKPFSPSHFKEGQIVTLFIPD